MELIEGGEQFIYDLPGIIPRIVILDEVMFNSYVPEFVVFLGDDLLLSRLLFLCVRGGFLDLNNTLHIKELEPVCS